jgi:pimeloyl-ACP methyl ester carboxylesterase
MKTSALIFLIFISNITFSQIPEIKVLKTDIIEIDKQKFTKIIGLIEVPEDREKPKGKILKLPVHIIKTKNTSPLESIFWLDGGPGHSNIMDKTYTQFLENHDFVMVGYRGADGNSVFKSKKVSRAIKGKGAQLLSDESLDNATHIIKKYANEIKEKGFNLTKYTILDVIDDMEYARKALQMPKINLYSVSYGTRVALLYGYKYPNSINRSVMVGANPPGHFKWYPQKTEQLLDKYDSLYKAQNLPGSIKESMKKAFAQMPKRWAGFKLDADKIKAATFSFIYDVDAAAMVFDAYFKVAQKHDYSGLYLLQLLFDISMTKNNLWGDMLAKGLSADFEPNINYREWHHSSGKNTVLGPNISLLLWNLADGWKPELIPEEYRKVQLSNVETLIISGNLDNSTPADFATEKLLPSLPNGQQVILKDYSHVMTDNHQKDQIRAMMAQYYKTGQADTSNIKYQPINFKPKKSINKMAKWGYPVWAVLSWLY